MKAAQTGRTHDYSDRTLQTSNSTCKKGATHTGHSGQRGRIAFPAAILARSEPDRTDVRKDQRDRPQPRAKVLRHIVRSHQVSPQSDQPTGMRKLPPKRRLCLNLIGNDSNLSGSTNRRYRPECRCTQLCADLHGHSPSADGCR